MGDRDLKNMKRRRRVARRTKKEMDAVRKQWEKFEESSSDDEDATAAKRVLSIRCSFFISFQ